MKEELRMFEGEVKGIRIYSRELSSLEIKNIYLKERKLYFKRWERILLWWRKLLVLLEILPLKICHRLYCKVLSWLRLI